MRAILGTEAPTPQPRPTRHRAPNVVSRLLDGGGRVEASRSAAVAAGIIVFVVSVVAVGWVLSSRPKAIPMPAESAPVSLAARPGTPTSTSRPTSAAPAADASDAAIVVDVAGKVRRPGLYRLASGARVDDAVRAAGGALPGVDLAALNLAAPLADGQQVAVGVPAAPAPSAGASPGGAASGRVHLNSATVEQLETLPGVGPVLAQHIVDYRAAHGTFTSVDQLNDVPGIGDAKFAAMRDAVAL